MIVENRIISFWLALGAFLVAYLGFEIRDYFSPLFLYLLSIFILYPIRKNLFANRLIILASTIFALWFFRTLSGIIFPFIIGLVAAFLLEPLTHFLTSKPILGKTLSRSSAALLITLTIVTSIVGLISFATPRLYEQIQSLAETLKFLPEQVQSVFNDHQTVEFFSKYGINVQTLQSLFFEKIHTQLFDFSKLGTELAVELAGNVPKAFSIILNLILIPFLSYYFIADFPIVEETFKEMISPKYSEKVNEYLRLAGTIFRQYLQGQFIIVLILSVLYSTAFWLIDLKYSLLIGVLFGVLSFIPYIGGIISVALALIAALFGENIFQTIGLIVVIYAVIHLFENFYLVPKIIGSKVHLNPLVLLFSVFIFGFFFNFIGVLLAVPLSAFLVAVYRKEFLDKKKPLPENESQKGSSN
ncbi:MAG: AI-2E family transporter [Chloroherpetonaceae bacterium]|nr:AI-2E family transporter [Chloroherpetonaceae bacterium]